MRKIGILLLLIAAVSTIFILPLGRGKTLISHSSALGLDTQKFLQESSKDNHHFLNTIEKLGAGVVKIPIFWQNVELTSGLFSWTLEGIDSQLDLPYIISNLRQNDVEVIAVLEGYPQYLTYENGDDTIFVSSYLESWEKYIKTVVDQFGEDVNAWQIGTGINLSDNLSGGSIAEIILSGPATYAEKLKRASKIIKSSDSNDILIAGGIKSDTGNCLNQPSAFLHSLFTLETWDAFDVIGIELQTYNSAPEFENFYQTYDILSGTCVTSAEGGFSLKEIVSFANSTAVQFGAKPIWISGLKWSEEQLQEISALRSLPSDAVRADYLARATLFLLGNENVERVLWEYPASVEPAPQDFSLFTKQVFVNLNSSLNGLIEIQDPLENSAGIIEKRFVAPSATQIFTWRSSGMDEFIPYTITDLDGYDLEAFSLDADSIEKRTGMELSVDQNGDSALLISERPVLIRAYSNNLKQKIALLFKGIFPTVKSGFEKTTNDILEAGKEKASQKVEDWVDENKESLFNMLKDSLLDWLKETIRLD